MKIILDDELQALDMVTNTIRNEESERKSVEAILSKSDTIVLEKQERWGRSQSRNPTSRTMITVEKDLSPKRET